LFIADFDVAPDEEIKEFAIGPEFGEAEIEKAARRCDASDDGMRVARRGEIAAVAGEEGTDTIRRDSCGERERKTLF